jgi:hypothetical protein
MDSARIIGEYNRNRGIIQAMWCVDSETGEEYLINVDTREIIAKRSSGRIADPQDYTGNPEEL